MHETHTCKYSYSWKLQQEWHKKATPFDRRKKKSPTKCAIAFILQWYKTGPCETCEKSNEKQQRWRIFLETKGQSVV